jgi:ComF family protein
VTPPSPNPQSLIPSQDLIPNPKFLIPSDGARGAANGLVAAILAPVCAVCNALLDEPLSGCVCGTCWRSILPITPPICDRCGGPLSRADAGCSNCVIGIPAVTRARAIGEYDGALREIIHAFKYSGRHSLARQVASLMRARGLDVLEGSDGVVPVPLHWRRRHQRGFNQARLLARHLGPPIIEALSRRQHTRPQVELAADSRHWNVANAFALRQCYRSRIIGMRLVIVDDVSTTGATLEACARVLKEGGASEVCALTAARVVTRRRPGQA